MKELKILYLYPDILELYGDFGNIQVLKYRLEKRGIKCIVEQYTIGDTEPDFCDYDLVFAGGGADQEQSILAKDLVQYKNNIKQAIDNLVKDHTIVIVAHRLSTIIDADIIYLIDDGKVVAEGTHKELLKNNEIYKTLYNSEN